MCVLLDDQSKGSRWITAYRYESVAMDAVRLTSYRNIAALVSPGPNSMTPAQYIDLVLHSSAAA